MTAHISEDGLNREETVAEHTEKTANLCREKGKKCNIPNIMYLCGILHDMGKNKQRFDAYIHADENTKRKLKGSIAHASTGAKYIYDKYHNSAENTDTKLLTEFIAYAVAAHHGLFDKIDIEKSDIFSSKLQNVEDYQEAYQNAQQDYLDNYKIETIFNSALAEFAAVKAKIYSIVKEVRTPNAIKTYQFYMFSCLQRLMLSFLIDADWEATSNFMNNTASVPTFFDNSKKDIFNKAAQNFEVYMKKMQESVKQSIEKGKMTEKELCIYSARNELQNQCRQFAKYSAGIYCLPIPTGGGKTLSSLAYALEYCKEHPQTERIIYISPYISITEQNADVFRKAIGNKDWILEHHSSVVREEEKTEEDYQINQRAALEVDWEEPFICTTFVQFMNILFSEKKQSLRLMHRLANAVVIIDEVQSMPLKCIHTFNYMVNFLNVICNTDIILCTATQPTLAETICPIRYSTPKYMIQNAKDWFEKFERVRIQLPEKGQKYTFESLSEEIAEQIQNFRSILIVLNTKSAVRKLYQLLKEREIAVEYLTTNLCAEHRSDKIKAIKKVLAQKEKPLVVVSTNLIEAGVDISFACVYRSMTGLDSLAQSAGRCNRNGEICGEVDKGIVHFIELEGEHTGNMEELMQSMNATHCILYQYKTADTNESILMPEWMEQYYKVLYQGEDVTDKMNFPIPNIAKNILELLSAGFSGGKKTNIMNQAFKTAGRAYQVIDDNSFGVIVPYKTGAEIIDAIQQAPDFAEIKKQIRKAQRYTVNVRGSQLKRMEGLIQPITEKIPNLYMIASTGSYCEDCGITEEWEPLIY